MVIKQCGRPGFELFRISSSAIEIESALAVQGTEGKLYISKSDWTKPGYRHSCQNKRDAKAMSIVNQVQ